MPVQSHVPTRCPHISFEALSRRRRAGRGPGLGGRFGDLSFIPSIFIPSSTCPRRGELLCHATMLTRSSLGVTIFRGRCDENDNFSSGGLSLTYLHYTVGTCLMIVDKIKGMMSFDIPSIHPPLPLVAISRQSSQLIMAHLDDHPTTLPLWN